MSRTFAELDFRKTALGDLSLRRRRVRALDALKVFEVKLGDAFLMSSLFHEVEVALADLDLAALGRHPAQFFIIQERNCLFNFGGIHHLVP